ncbi:hypothetical protein AKJ09_10247 [Labilithrix luteola]|uniref:Uncharacterized protein n=1 Tax=Labilithrix luteola TaxID=1391654 RepID=A0A0K1QCV5_9BACT|nr:hypothetical protein AKJ09_10247 [Labilithrix luteola]
MGAVVRNPTKPVRVDFASHALLFWPNPGACVLNLRAQCSYSPGDGSGEHFRQVGFSSARPIVMDGPGDSNVKASKDQDARKSPHGERRVLRRAQARRAEGDPPRAAGGRLETRGFEGGQWPPQDRLEGGQRPPTWNDNSGLLR